jgi:predicted metalloenzyme YecM
MQEAYRKPIKLDQKRKYFQHIKIKIQNTNNKERLLKVTKEEGEVVSQEY